jgi:uncharacterized protein (TIGR00297 family)
MPPLLLVGSIFAFIISAGSFVFRFLTFSGAIAAFLLGVVVFGIGGWQWAIPLLMFFLLSSLLSKDRRSRKEQFDSLFEKSHTRDWGQVASNGSLAGMLVLLSASFPIYDFYPIYLGALAAVTADTWGTEIGVLTKGRTLSILSMQSVSPGTSGGISESGTMAGAVGAIVIALSGYAWYSDLKTGIIVIVAGMVGSFADSVIGATLQGQFRCVICGKPTERAMHCDSSTTRVAGVSCINNDAVNLVCSLVGAVTAWVLMLVL